ncbi:membrane protein insertion efficiency factor YidD [Miniphocaeibacter massiliensis]|uniref:membrane protein insertion efficiency factor YidD n=1 Tax=Miniphocaeibacter massiliensis TaxID=2041841 RepID=UPI000C1BB92F|nr:membrane protein insertion efficiency factor YidD [Miniphocaeibacter massiliensis]
MKKIAIFLIKFYQKNISPYWGSGCCKYYPTCSQYSLQAYSKYGFFKGTVLTVWRILRCNPFSKGGYDPLK